MIPMSFITVILITHFIADFVLQSDTMAKNKSKSNKHLLNHVLVYTACLAVASLFLFYYSTPFSTAAMWVWLNAVLHFVTDYFTSRASSKLWQKGDVHNFFVVIGFDQVIHYMTLFGTFLWLSNS